MADHNTYTISIDWSWSLENFYELPHVFGQVYAFHCAFTVEVRDRDRLNHAFASYPWRGGYSAVNFYNVLSSQVPYRLRPQVESIKYASPGWIALTGVMTVVTGTIGRAVRGFVRSTSALNKLYSEIYEGHHGRRLMRIEERRQNLQLAGEELNFAIESSERLAAALGFKNLAALNDFTGNSMTSTKILLSYFRRVRILASYVEQGKAEFPADERPQE